MVDRLPSRRSGTAVGAGGRLVLVHGFAQNSACWAPVDADLAADHEVLAVDLPGHGPRDGNVERSDPTDDLWGIADRLAVTGGRAVYLGYSMGARVCLHLALAHPEVVEALVLVSGTGGIDDPKEREARRAADEELARRIEQDGVEAFLTDWLAQPMFERLTAPQRHLEARRRNTASGLAGSLRVAGTGTQDPLWDRLDEITCPTLVVTGDDDPKFTAIGDRLAATIGPAAARMRVPGAGHTVHLEAPAEFVAGLRHWLASLD